MHNCKHVLRAILPAFLLAASLVPSASRAAQARTGYRIAYLPKAIGNPYFNTALSGAKKAAATNGDTVTQVGPTQADPSGQVTYIKSLIQQHVDAIIVAADAPAVVAPSLEQAMSRGIKVVSFDSDTLPTARQIFCNQASSEAIGRVEVQILGREIGYKGDIAILSGLSTAANQNTWIGYMKQELALPKYKGMRLVTTVYGNDDAALSTTLTQGLLSRYHNLRGIIAPSTVGIKAAAQVVTVSGKIGKVVVTGLGTPNDMRTYVQNGAVPDFALWNVADLGYLMCNSFS